MVSIVELLIGISFAVKAFGSDETFKTLMDTAGGFTSPPLIGLSSSGFGDQIKGPAAILLLVLGFMIFCFILITIIPRAVEKREKEINMEMDFE